MRFYKPADSQPCYYCEHIANVEHEKNYPIRDGVYTYENYIFRCTWHSRFTCSRCGGEHHFSWFYWCPECKELVCGDCTKPTMKPVAFWDRTYAYQFYCDMCNEYHYDLLYTEFQGSHPWQIGVRTIQSNIESSEPWFPLWIPSRQREGRHIELEDALKLPNRVLQLREELVYPAWRVTRHAVPEEEIDFTETRDKWDDNSADYIEFCKDDMQGDPNRQFIIDPAMWSLIGDVKDLTVLDAGCGHGYLTRLLATKGANAVGVDFSKSFITHCKELESKMNLGCTFYEASLTDMSDFTSQSFDLIVSNIVMIDVLDYRAAFKEIARVLKDDGRFIWSNVHPVFGRTAGALDPRIPRDSPRSESRYLKMIDRYFDTGGELLSDWMSTPTWQFIRTFEEYSKALKAAGFVISEILEPRPTPEVIQQHPRRFAFDADRWTHFVIFECLKRV